ncbi:MAG: glycyl-radical enzyme activating protein [Myxococcales bacterium]|nr:glycyl-radical enzyme activating protein [Myxococcales bacterium]
MPADFAAEPLILDVKHNSLDDGPGIRSTVFFKGCPLDCAWCHNPESKSPEAELAVDPAACVNCGACAAACPHGAIRPGAVDRDRCRRDFRCAAVCPTEALRRLGRYRPPAEILAELKRYLPFFRNSGGGLTLSGGEPTLYPDYAAKLLRGAKQLGIRTLLETGGLFDFTRFQENLLPWLDAIYFDLKLMDDGQHREFCGAPNGRILDNFRRLAVVARTGFFRLLPRVPLVPGLTDTDENLAAIARFLDDCGVRRVDLLPYNPTWTRKAVLIDRPTRLAIERWQTPDELERCRRAFAGFAIER